LGELLLGVAKSVVELAGELLLVLPEWVLEQ
jgi:hypothetical protein